jgi:hypothetical protein
MKTGVFSKFGFVKPTGALRHLVAALAIGCALAGLGAEKAKSQSTAYVTTAAYVTQFYPLWFTYYQYQVATHNRMVGPAKISPLYQIVVAINDDTLYASTFLDLTAQPIVLTIPATTATYSILTLDPYGDVFDVGLPALTPGVFALAGPGFIGTLPGGVTPISLPYNVMSLIFRADKFSSTGQDQTSAANSFRAALMTQTLCDYQNLPCPDATKRNPSGGTALILPEVAFATPFKTAADALATQNPIAFLKQLQTAVTSANTPPKSAYEQGLSNQFNVLFGNGNFGKNTDFAAATQAAHAAIVDNYTSHLGPNNWIHFTNIGNWGDNVLDRSSITEFIQFGNDISTAAYYHTFEDCAGAPLDGSNAGGYVLTFPSAQLPQAERFWSLTAYTPQSIELIANPANKYVVASYTPGLQYNTDGSLTIIMATKQPPGVPMANWLPISNRPFNIMLRVYGVPPGGDIADDTYVPPGIVRTGGTCSP